MYVIPLENIHLLPTMHYHARKYYRQRRHHKQRKARGDEIDRTGNHSYSAGLSDGLVRAEAGEGGRGSWGSRKHGFCLSLGQ